MQIQAALSDLRRGIPAKHEFLPSVANIVAMGNKLAAEIAETERRRSQQPMRPVEDQFDTLPPKETPSEFQERARKAADKLNARQVTLQ